MSLLQKKLTVILFIAFFYLQLTAQQNTKGNTTADSSQLSAEKYILEQSGQEKIDSIIASRLQKELDQVDMDSKKRKELEKKLQKISEKDSARKAAQVKRISELKLHTTGYPVSLLSRRLFYIYTRVGSFSAAERAQATSKRIREFYDDAFFDADSLQVVQNEVIYDIVYQNDRDIMSVTELDALWYNEDAATLANDYLLRIRQAVISAREENSVGNWLKRAGHISLIIAGICIIIYVVNRLFRRIAAGLGKHQEKYFKGIRIRQTQILSTAQHYKAAMQVNNIVRILIIILSLYIALPLLFGLFTQTRGFAEVLWSWITKPVKVLFSDVVTFLPNVFTIAVIFIITRYLIRVIRYFASGIDKDTIHIEGFYREWAWPTYHIIKFLIYAFMFVVIFPYLPGSNSPAFRGVSVFLGVLLSLGSSSAISNIIAGLVITYMRPYKIGNRVKIGDVEGDVIEKTMLVTRIRTIKNEDVTVPNSTVLNTATVNYSANTQPTGLIIHTTVTIGYAVPWKDMHKALIDAALRTDLVLKQPAPFVLQTSLDDFFVSYQINAYTKEANRQAEIYSSIHQHIQDVCNERGIEIMSPHYHAIRDGNTVSIPPDYVQPGYRPGSFNIYMNENKPD